MTELESAGICTVGGAIAPDRTKNGSYEVAERLAAIVESSDDAIVAKDLNGVITSWNKGAENLFGFTEEEAIGKPITIIIPAEYQNEEPLILARIRRGDRIDHYETVRQRKDGSLVEVSLTVSPIKNARGQIAGASKIARDITERKRAEDQQKLLLREMSHRIKNLFTLAGSIVALSARGASSPEELARSVQERLAALGRAHDLTLTRPTPEAPLRTRPATLHALIQTILLPFENQGKGEEKRATVTGLDIPIGQAQVTGFALLLHELATNASKYGALAVPHGRIYIGCSEENGQFIIDWKEYGNADIESEEEGFGTILVQATVKRQLGGKITRERRPEGIAIRLIFPAARLASGPGLG